MKAVINWKFKQKKHYSHCFEIQDMQSIVRIISSIQSEKSTKHTLLQGSQQLFAANKEKPRVKIASSSSRPHIGDDPHWKKSSNLDPAKFEGKLSVELDRQKSIRWIVPCVQLKKPKVSNYRLQFKDSDVCSCISKRLTLESEELELAHQRSSSFVCSISERDHPEECDQASFLHAQQFFHFRLRTITSLRD